MSKRADESLLFLIFSILLLASDKDEKIILPVFLCAMS